MLKVDPTLDHVPAKKEHVIALFESINQPLVNVPTYGTAPTGAFVLGTRNDQGAYTAFVYLYQVETRAVVVYVSEPRGLSTEQYRQEEQEAVRFVESMGFMIDNVHFPTLAPPEQEAVMARIPMFRPPAPPAPSFAQSSSDPFAATEQQLDAIFGGFSAQDADVFRQAITRPPAAAVKGALPPLGHNAGLGTSPPGAPMTPPPMTQPPMSQPPSQPPLNHTQMGPPPAGAPPFGGPSLGSPPVGGFASGPPMTPAATMPPLPPLDPPTSSPASIPISSPSSPSSAPIGGPSNNPSSPEQAAALERLGRLLGAFVWPMAFLLAMSGGACKSGGASNSSPEAIVAQVDIGNQQLASGQWAQAIRAFDLVLEEDDEHPEALRGLGLAYMNLGRLVDAEKYYRRSVKAQDDWSIPKNELAVVLLQTGRCAEAQELLEAVLKDIFYNTPEYAEHNLARARQCQGDVADAIDRLEKLVLKRPQFCLGYLTLAEFSAQAKNHELTISACDDFAHNCEQHKEISKQVSPEQSDLCYLKKGLAYAEMGDLESARAAFSRCQSRGQLGRECKKSLEMLPP